MLARIPTNTPTAADSMPTVDTNTIRRSSARKLIQGTYIM